MNLKIAFHTPQLDLRGSCEALWCYAHYNEIILGNSSIVVVPLTGIQKDDRAISKFTRRFQLVVYQNVTELEEKLLMVINGSMGKYFMIIFSNLIAVYEKLFLVSYF